MDDGFVSRVEQVLSPRMEGSRAEFSEDAQKLANEMNGRGLLTSGAHIKKLKKMASESLDVRGRLIWETIRRVALARGQEGLSSEKIVDLFSRLLKDEFVNIVDGVLSDSKKRFFSHVSSDVITELDVSHDYKRTLGLYEGEIALFIDSRATLDRSRGEQQAGEVGREVPERQRVPGSAKIFVGSPSDVAEEREALESVVHEINRLWSAEVGLMLELERWETHARPDFGVDAQDVINQQIGDDCDVFIGIFWSRVGTPTKRSVSGSVEEFERALERYRKDSSSVKIMVYFKEAPISPSAIDGEQLTKLQEFKQSLGERGGLYWTFGSLSEFESITRTHLSMLVRDWRRDGFSVVVPEEKLGSESEKTCEEEPDTSDEFGFLDHLDEFDQSNAAMCESLRLMSTATTTIATAFSERTADIAEVEDMAGERSRSGVKKIIGQTSKDLDQFRQALAAQLPIFSKTSSSALESLGKALVVYEDFGNPNTEDLETLANGVQGMNKGAVDCIAGLNDMKKTINNLPRVTIQFNKSKRRVVDVLDRVVDAVGSTLATTEDILVAIDRLMNTSDN